MIVRVFQEIFRPSLQTFLLASMSFLVAMHFWKWFQQRFRCSKNNPGPPGPLSWPVIGNAAQLGSLPHTVFSKMAQKYGNVFRIKLGNRVVVVLNGEDAIKEALIKKGVDFAGRPDFTSFKVISGGKGMAFNGYSDLWKIHRKVAHSTIRHFSTCNQEARKSFEQGILSEIKEVIGVFLKKSEDEKFFEASKFLAVAVANTMSAVCFGKRYSYDDAEFQSLIGRNDQFAKTVGAGSIVDVMPWLQSFPNPIKTMFDNFKTLNEEFYDFIYGKVVQHRATLKAGTIRDMTDAFIVALDQGKEVKNGAVLGKEHVPPTVNDIFGASQDTLSTAMHWMFRLLVRFPDVQEKLQKEIDEVVGRNRLPCIEDQQNLPNVVAFIFETMRFSSFVPITIPHATTTDTSVMGYHIPKNTVVFINQWSVNHDPQKWSNPDVFDPTRFLDEDGILNKDLISSVMIFSVGKRRCIGDELSKMVLFLFVSVLLHQCNFTADPNGSRTIESFYGLTLKPKPFKIEVTSRVPV
ncbi:cytochrome P450 1B1 [Polypterus senegalus]|nr:cytochrome P450 1B1 [Polypterus senegalus]XP_039594351.1 cytochrome P450 1B1 [Polypterus senegalus]